MVLASAANFKPRLLGDRLLRSRIADVVDNIRNAVAVDGAKGDEALVNAEIAALRDVWAEEYRDGDGASWPDVQARLHEVLTAALVVEVNSSRGSGSLDYAGGGEYGLTVIAVGGFSLSRGLTLEGLTVSYFLRNSMMYDTLMQMGRWFGYRPGYEDLCRVWMLADGVGWYAHISEAMDELQLDLKRMEAARATPEDFGLAVRSHPETLIVTARNKMGSGQLIPMKVGLANRFVETSRLSAAKDTILHNRALAKNFVTAMSGEGFEANPDNKIGRGYLLKMVPVSLVRDFLIGFRGDNVDPLTDAVLISRYIDERLDELGHWDVLIASVNEGTEEFQSTALGPAVGQAGRKIGKANLTDGVLAISGSSRRVGSPGDEKVGVDPSVAAKALSDFLEEYERAGTEPPKTIPDHIYRVVRSRPLLILRLIKIIRPEDISDALALKLPDGPVVAYSISFPTSETNDGRVDYVVNTRRFQELFGVDEDEEEAAGDAA